MSKRKLWAWAGMAVVAAILAFVYLGSTNSGFQYKLEPIEKGDLAVVITATGRVNPVTRVQVGTQISGTISKIYADFNQKVTRGQVIAQIDPTFLNAQLQEAEANLEKAKAQVVQMKKTLERASELFDRKLISQAEKDEAVTNYDLAVAQEKQARAAYNRAEVSLQYTNIVSPIDGVVISRNVDVGQTVAASLQAPILFLIANDLSKIQVEATIGEVDIGKVKVGQEVSFYVDAYPDEKFSGRIGQVRLQPITQQNVVSYEVIIDVVNEENKLLPGMTANISIIVDTRSDVLKVPNMALRYQPSLSKSQYQTYVQLYGDRFDLKNTAMVWTLDETSELLPIPVQPGITDGQFTEVNGEKLQPGLRVITGIQTASVKSIVPGR